MDAIHHNDVIIICGATGSGKTTQVPQFLWEGGFGHPQSQYPGMIGVTEPRRIATMSVCSRVEEELNEVGTGRVGYQIRYESHVYENQEDSISEEEKDETSHKITPTKHKTRLKFMTDGILLREMESDPFLWKYSAIILDEAHERTANTDIVIGLLSRVVLARKRLSMERKHKVESISGEMRHHTPLKVVIMSATLELEELTTNKRLFPFKVPVINISGRQFPITLHFNRITHHDYVDVAFKKICKIHKQLPPGNILVFLTGRDEVEELCKRLRSEFPLPAELGGTKSKSAKARTSDDQCEIGLILDEDAIEEQMDLDTTEASNNTNSQTRRKTKKRSSAVGQEEDDESAESDALLSTLPHKRKRAGRREVVRKKKRDSAPTTRESESSPPDDSESSDEHPPSADEADSEEETCFVVYPPGFEPDPSDPTVAPLPPDPNLPGYHRIANPFLKTSDEQTPPELPVPLHVCPLYSLLSSSAQKAIFDPPPYLPKLIKMKEKELEQNPLKDSTKPRPIPIDFLKDEEDAVAQAKSVDREAETQLFKPPINPSTLYRQVIVATNIAETTLTIPDVVYIVDCGKVKEKMLIDNQSSIPSDPSAPNPTQSEQTDTTAITTPSTENLMNALPSGVVTFHVHWTSKASADQRSGRCGRTQPGHCYRLFSSNVYVTQFPAHKTPELRQIPLDSLVLSMVSIGIDDVFNFPFISPPSPAILRTAINTLQILGAVEIKKIDRNKKKKRTVESVAEEEKKRLKEEQEKEIDEQKAKENMFGINAFREWDKKQSASKTEAPKKTSALSIQLSPSTYLSVTPTSLGLLMSRLPVIPRYAVILIEAMRSDVLEYALPAITAMSVRELEAIIFVDQEKEAKKKKKKDAETAHLSKELKPSFRNVWSRYAHESDYLGQMAVLLGFSFECTVRSEQAKGEFNVTFRSRRLMEKWCRTNFVRMKGVVEAQKMRVQLARILARLFTQSQLTSLSSSDLLKNLLNPSLQPPSQQEYKSLKQAFLSGFSDQVAVLTRVPITEKVKVKNEMQDDYDNPEPVFKEVTRTVSVYRPASLAKKSTAVEDSVMDPASSFAYIHPSSFVHGPTLMLPDVVAYTDITATHGQAGTAPPDNDPLRIRLYMKGVTAIDSSWLYARCSPLLLSQTHIVAPQPSTHKKTATSVAMPFFSSQDDAVVSYVEAVYSPLSHPLPPIALSLRVAPHIDPVLHSILFLCSLLKGEVFPSVWASFTESTLSEMTKQSAEVYSFFFLQNMKSSQSKERSSLTTRDGAQLSLLDATFSKVIQELSSFKSSLFLKTMKQHSPKLTDSETATIQAISSPPCSSEALSAIWYLFFILIFHQDTPTIAADLEG
ncbi:putative ATP-dependent RNA helicase DEAH13 [Blattamonas nauphoetae]|uniref:ATP-dependent RNA helicase DEAH13 n=1 Tax=Blattamonas nauphoetae TaxID=2049346 RepID=A0ABQ9XH94_9EUKA|nr:putative ATP-dependent RNA helicase DEAH13 [Blattamonas nauphoetae]